MMPDFGDISYATGKADVTASSVTVAASGAALWDGIKPGDIFVCQGLAVPIAAIGGGYDTLTLASAWAGATASGADYVILKSSPSRPTTAEIGASWEAIRTAMQAQGFIYNVAAPRTEPDAAWGKDGDFAFKLDGGAFKIWDKTGGAWVLRTQFLNVDDLAAARAVLGVRERLTAARSYYVRADGSDANSGLADTAGGAFATIQRAIDVASGLDTGVYDVNVFVGAGVATPNGIILRRLLGTGYLSILGDADNQASVTISSTGTAVTNAGSGRFIVNGVRLAGDLFDVSVSGCELVLQSADFAGGGGSGIFCVFASAGAKINITGSKTKISWAGFGGFVSEVGSGLYFANAAVKITANLSYSYGFAVARNLGYVECAVTSFDLDGHTVTGSAAVMNAGGQIVTDGSTFPGD